MFNDFGLITKESAQCKVRLVEHPSRLPATAVERFAVAILKQKGEVPLDEVVRDVAHRVYLDEIRCGAAVLDIGLFGSNLFVPDVASELKAGNGVLWEIEGGRPRE